MLHDGAALPSCGILVRCYRKDLAWLTLCLAAVERFASGFARVVVVLPRPDVAWLRRRPPLPDGVELRLCDPCADDYLGQQVTKLHADRYLDTDLVCHLDADVILTRPVTPELIAPGGRPRIAWRPYAELGRHWPWRGPTEEFLGWPVAFDYMQQPPFVYPRFLYAEVRDHAQAVHGVDLATYVLARPPRGFSEFNVLGAFARARHPSAFAWVDVDEYGMRPRFCRWYWSHDGVDARTMEEIGALLAVPVAP